MNYQLKLRVEAFHVPTDRWFVAEHEHGVRAVSAKHALNKGLAIAQSWPAYADRLNAAGWENVSAEAVIIPVPQILHT